MYTKKLFSAAAPETNEIEGEVGFARLQKIAKKHENFTDISEFG